MEEDLRYDDELLARAEPVFRLWEAPRPCVVLGRSGRPERDVNTAECERLGVPILRRASGGGAVVLGPGCLNYTLVFPLQTNPHLIDVRAGTRWIMERICRALDLEDLTVEGASDLAWRGRKVSGNAQKRTKGAVLHHGTLLYNFDFELPARLLHPPLRQPAYRGGRPDPLFLANLPETLVRRQFQPGQIFPGLQPALELLHANIPELD